MWRDRLDQIPPSDLAELFEHLALESIHQQAALKHASQTAVATTVAAEALAHLAHRVGVDKTLVNEWIRLLSPDSSTDGGPQKIGRSAKDFRAGRRRRRGAHVRSVSAVRG